jgi:glutamate dehydrogenase/leucine dehydrogenase
MSVSPPNTELARRDEGGCTVYTALRNGQALGYVAVDSTVAGRSCGGVRIATGLSEEEVRILARSMTLKYGFLGLPQGGAKAGLIGDADGPLEDRRRRLVEFGRIIRPLLSEKLFVPCADMGTTADDIRYMLEQLGLSVARRQLRSNQSGHYTAVSVLAGADAAADHLGLHLADCRVAIEGFGKVGSALCGMLDRRGAKVVAVSTSRGAIYNDAGLDAALLLELARRHGSDLVKAYPRAQFLAPAQLLELPADLLCPCARHNCITSENAHSIQARIICAGANHFATDQAQEILQGRGVLVLPDFVTNCGGVLGGTMEFASIAPAAIEPFILARLGPAISRLLQEAAREGISPTALAARIAQARREQVNRNARQRGLKNWLLGLGLELYRHGLVPSGIMAPLAMRYFNRLLKHSGQ